MTQREKHASLGLGYRSGPGRQRLQGGLVETSCLLECHDLAGVVAGPFRRFEGQIGVHRGERLEVVMRDLGKVRPARGTGAFRDDLGRAPVKVAATRTVNGVAYTVELAPGTSLLAAVRDEIGLTGSKEGCDDSECGACMMLLDGEPVNSCSYLALQAERSEITTVEGLADGRELSALQTAFLEHGGVQCGFCTPGMLISATALLERNP